MAAVLLMTLVVSEPVKIAILCDDVPALQEFAGELERELHAAGWQPSRVPPGEWRHLCNVDYTEVLQLITQAKDDFYDLKLKSAHKQLLLAERFMQETLWLDAPEELQELYLLLGWVELERRKKRLARAQFRRSLHLWPLWRPSHSEHPPNVKSAFAAVAARENKKQRMGRLVVETNPPGASITVNGFSQQVCPCELPAGEHFVAVSHLDYGRVVRKLRIETNQTLRLDLDFARDRRAVWARWIATHDVASLQSSVGKVGEVVVVLTAELAKPIAVIVRNGVAQVSRGGVAVVMAALLSSAETEIVKATEVSQSSSPGPALPRTKLAEIDENSHLWLWTAVAIVAVSLIAGGTTYAIWRSEDDVRFRIRP